jgi:ParB-like chromosome segregation protein Spo0J
MPFSKHPISRIQWIDVNKLNPNEYNPNHVLTAEMKLLKFSILKSGWIQPILVSEDMHIIDGFHRYTLAKTQDDVWALTHGKVPCAVLDINEAERMMLTVRINRAKGNHIALKMHELVTTLVETHGLSPDEIGKNIGADKHEIETLLMENVFEKKDVANKPFSRAWYPKGSGATKGREW